jgi:spore coat protein CotH
MAVSTAWSNLDSYQGSLAHNYYLYEQDGVFSLLPWDYNESFAFLVWDAGQIFVNFILYSQK